MQVVNLVRYNGNSTALLDTDLGELRARAYNSITHKANVVHIIVPSDEAGFGAFVNPAAALRFAFDLIQVAREAGADAAYSPEPE